MRTREKLRDIQKSLYSMRVANGRYLRDVPLQELTEDEQKSIRTEARHILFKTDFELRLVLRQGRRTWRFFDRAAVYSEYGQEER